MRHDSASFDEHQPDVSAPAPEADERADDRAAFGDARAVVLRWQVPGELAGTRADQLLVARVRRLSRTRAQSLIRRGDFRTPEGPLKPSARLFEGQEVELWRIPPDEVQEGDPVPRVIHEDEELLVLDKPGDLAVHPSARYLRRTVTHWLKSRHDGGRIPHPCHRLDRETSGVLLCAKTRRAEAAVKTAFADGRVEKTYLAVVRGAAAARGWLTWPLALQGDRGLVRIKMVHDPSGLAARTLIAPIHVDAATDRTLLACRPRTGRQHQIRAHLALAGHPVVGDKLYAMGEAWFDRFTRDGVPEGDELELPRQALHAARAELMLDGNPRNYRAPLPADLRALLPSLDLDDEGVFLQAARALDEGDDAR